MKKLMLWMIAFAALSGGSLLAQDITGTWQGTLQAGKELRTVVKISRADDGLKAVLYSIDQGGQPLPVNQVTVQGATVKMSIPGIGGTYEGRLEASGITITGTWTQGGAPLPLKLTRATPETAWTIPEPPPPPKMMAADATPAFEVATIKPSRPEARGKGIGVAPSGMFTTMNTSLSDLIQFSYGLHARQIMDGPAWLETEKYDLAAKADHEGIPNLMQLKTMVQKLLAERFQLASHHDKKELSVYAITVAKTGPKLTKSDPTPVPLPGFGIRRGILTLRNATMADFAGLLQANILERPVVDQTGLTVRYDFVVKYTPDTPQPNGDGGNAPAAAADTADPPPDLFTAIQEQLGLKLESTKTAADVLVIDRVEKPSEN